MRIIYFITVLVISWAGSINAQESSKYKLTDDPIYQEGINALTDHLPAIASKKFTQILKSQPLTNEVKAKLLLLLAESQIRATKPNQALTTLSTPIIAKNPDTSFWKGQALATAGRYHDAILELEKVNSKSNNFQFAQIKIANLAAALNDIDKAISTLTLSVKNNKPVSPQTFLSLANLYIVKKDPANATKTLAKIDSKDERSNILKQLIQAQIDILQENHPNAILLLNKLVKTPEKLDSKTLNFANLYLADALYMNGNTQEAIDTLINSLDSKSSQLLGSIFARLGKWIPNNTPITDNNIKKLISWSNDNNQDNINQLSLEDEQRSDLSAFSLYYYARYLARQTEPTSKTKALSEFTRLRIRYPTHILAGTSLTDTATTQLSLGRVDAAKQTLKLIQQLSIPIAPIAKQQAAFLLGRLNLDEKNYAAAAAAYQAVVDSASGQLRTASIINAASSYLEAADIKGFHKLQKDIKSPSIQTNLTLENALWLARENKIEARTILQEFILNHPNHTRLSEAQLALSLHCLRVPPLDLPLSQTIITKIHKANLKDNQYIDYYHLLYRSASANSNYGAAADAATQFLDAYPENPHRPKFTLLQGQALYHNGQHNDARTILLDMEKAYPDYPLLHYAKYYAAMSAKLEGTPQSEEKAIELFKKITTDKSPLASEALLQLAELHLYKNQPQLAIKALKPVFDAQPKGKKSLNLGLLLASAYHDQGNLIPKNFNETLKIYDNLIQQNPANFQIINQIKYNKALTLQHMGNDDQALEIYYSVIDIKNKPITEWKWYYKCGFTAIAMLEEKKKPHAAIAIAKRLASTKGTRAKEASKRARSLEMKFMIWEQ